MKIYLLFTALLISGSHAFSVPAIKPDQHFLNPNNPSLNGKEQRATNLAGQWVKKGIKPYFKDGQIIYIFGVTLPSVVCAPLQLCDIELQAGETVKNMNAGDPRWNIEQAYSGPDGRETPHILVKPMDVGIPTILIVTTDRRTYHIKLLSRKRDYTPSIAFQYPDEQRQVLAQQNERMKKIHQEKTLSDTGENLKDLNFEYDISGHKNIKPLRAYNNGVKTIIQMPKLMTATEAPILLVIDESNNEQLVNYRLHQDRYIVDQLFQKAVLVSGVGSSQKKATITRR